MELVAVLIAIGTSVLGALAGGLFFAVARNLWLWTHTSDVQVELDRTLNDLREILDEISTSGALAPPEGAASIGTDELIRSAGPEAAARLLEALELKAQHKEREAIDALYEAFRRDLGPSAKAELHILIGNSFLNLSELEEAEGHYRQAVDACREASLREGEATALGNLGLVYRRRGDLERAREHHQQALAIHRDISSRRGESYQLGSLGNVLSDQGDVEHAREHHDQALTIHREIGDRLGEARDLGNLGNASAAMGDLDRAEEYLEMALAIHREIGNRLGEAKDLASLGLAYGKRGDINTAERLLQEALAIGREIGHRLYQANSLGNLGLLAAERNLRDQACRLLKEAAGIYDETGAGGPGPDKVRAKLDEMGCE